MMQNNKWNQVKQVMKKKGYYIVLFLCLIAVGTSGYLYYRNQDTTKPKSPDEQSLHLEESNIAESQTPAKQTPPAQDVISVIPKATQTKPEAAMPLEGDAIAAFSADHLSYNETTKDWRTHAGIDIAAELGEKVCAAADGVVYAVYDDEQFGKTVVLAHKGDYKTYYSNLAAEISVKIGDTVTAGAILGTVGETAVAEALSEPHLHFAVYQGTTPVDPQEFFN